MQCGNTYVRFIVFGWLRIAGVWQSSAESYQLIRKTIHTLFKSHASKSPSKLEATINKSESHVCAWV